MTTTAQLNYANYLISKLKVSEQFKARLREEVESMNMDAAIGFIDDLNRGDLSAWEMEAVVYQEGDLGERPGKA